MFSTSTWPFLLVVVTRGLSYSLLAVPSLLFPLLQLTYTDRVLTGRGGAMNDERSFPVSFGEPPMARIEEISRVLLGHSQTRYGCSIAFVSGVFPMGTTTTNNLQDETPLVSAVESKIFVII
ncbi:hypothetical protein BC827DRAFT_1193366 [Russula dissimulans]|nr:hypothetical protein BC827DRAFT_1193366 [Russula dissimulans]